MGRQAFGTRMEYRETFLQIHMHLHQHLIHKNCINGIHRAKNRSTRPQWRKKWKARTKSRSEMPVWIVSQKISHPLWGRLFKELWSRPPATFACWKIRFKTEVCTCSQFPTEAMQWIKEVEMVDSVDEFKSSSSIRGISMPNFELLWCEDCCSAEQDHPYFSLPSR